MCKSDFSTLPNTKFLVVPEFCAAHIHTYIHTYIHTLYKLLVYNDVCGCVRIRINKWLFLQKCGGSLNSFNHNL